MNIDIVKEVTIEYIENMYALLINYLNNNNNIEFKNTLKELEFLEEKVRICDDLNTLNNYRNLLENLFNRIEGIINE